MIKSSLFVFVAVIFLPYYTLSCYQPSLENEGSFDQFGAEYYNRAGKEMVERLKLYEESIPLFEKSISIDPKNALFYNNISLSFWKTGRQEKSIQYLKLAIKLDPAYAAPHYNLGKFYLSIERLKKSILHYKKGIVLFENKLRAKPVKDDIDGSTQDIQLKIALSHAEIGIVGDYLRNAEIAIMHSKLAEMLFLKNKNTGYYKIAKANLKKLLKKYEFNSFLDASRAFKKKIVRH